MKKLLLLFLGYFFWGCQQQPELNTRKTLEIPSHVLLEDSQSETIGIGVPIDDRVFVTADHLLEKYENIFWKEHEIEIFARDFDNNILFFRLPHWIGLDVRWSDSPPVIGSEIFWMNDLSISQEHVHSIKKLSKDQIQKDIIVISGIANIKNSGAPIFDAQGKVFGILVGGDKTQKLSFAIRSDVILDILQENTK
jgi:hypothetical protein